MIGSGAAAFSAAIAARRITACGGRALCDRHLTRQGPTVLTTLRHPEARSDQLNGQQLLVAAGAARSPTR